MEESLSAHRQRVVRDTQVSESLLEERIESLGFHGLAQLLGFGRFVGSASLIEALTNAPFQADFPADPPRRKL